ncbi:phosphatase 2C-like domain-containing protein [Collybia nuda]|uniref:Phosphatase 2C-like domain-containing protein n=1 Tax=Collybia nuda TaxID=64659 RepID=A0A9P5Y230_9AGAR|nr:phosphatase 2C-like domain-containing protein [Collybia nuda]
MTLCGIFDGHNGPSTSSILSLSLPTAVLQALDHLFSSSTSLSEHDPSLSPSEQGQDHESLEHSEHSELGSPPTPTRPSDASIDRAIKSAFLAVDKSLITDSLHAALSHPTPRSAHTTRTLAPALSGSCALLSIFEPATRQLRVALTGDSRAVLGRRIVDPSTGKERYEVHVLSEDQNGYNPKEVERMSAAHPGETVSEKGRVMGWGMSRAFGDALTKWSLEDQERVRKECLGDRSYSNIKTPPYFSAEPEITTTQVREGDFLVMASDGLWESLTNAEAVGLVGVWLRENKVSRKRGASTSNSFMQGSNSGVGEREVVRPGAKPIERDDLPVELEAQDKTVRYRSWRAEKKFLNVDDNVAVHLARNALGGADRELTGALLALTPPRARRFRDDISVSVIFFD